MNGTVSSDERLQPGEIRVHVFFIVDLNAHAHTLGHLCCVQPKLRRICCESLIPRVDISDPSDRQLYPDAASFEVVNHCLIHSDRHTLRGGSIGCFVQQSQRLNETQNHQVDGWSAITSIYQPAVTIVEIGHVTNAGPG